MCNAKAAATASNEPTKNLGPVAKARNKHAKQEEKRPLRLVIMSMMMKQQDLLKGCRLCMMRHRGRK